MEPEMEHQEKMNAWIADMNDGRKERMACQETMEANPDGAKARIDAAQRGASRGPQGRSHSEIFWSTEEAAQGPASGHRAPPETKGEDLDKLWIPEEMGCRPQRDGLLCKNGTFIS
jgi:hypothetical protein